MRRLGIVAMCGWVAAASVAQEAKPAEGAAPAREASAAGALMASAQRSLMAEKWEDAAGYCQRILEQDPTNDEARFGLGTAYGQLGKYKEALELFEALLKSNPDNSALKNNMAWVYVKAKDPAFQDYGKAVKLARDAVLASPADFNIWNTLAEAYYGLKDYDRALRAARHALRLSTLAGVSDVKPYRELLERCQDAADSEEKAP